MSLYEHSIPQFIKLLSQVQRWLDKAEAHATAKKFTVDTLLTARLAPDMYPLVKQIQTISDSSKGTAARLAGVAPPSFPDEEKTVTELRARIDKTIEFLKSLKPEQFEGAERRTVTLPWFPGKGVTGLDYLIEFGLPNLYFHLATTYDILRHNGVELGKADFIGSVKFFDV